MDSKVEKSSSNQILGAYKFDDIKDVNLKYLMVVGYTQSIMLVVKANNDGLSDYSVSAALASTLQCINIIQSQTPADKMSEKYHKYRSKIEYYYKQLHNSTLSHPDKAKAMMYCQNIHRAMSRKLSELIRGFSFEHPTSATI